LSSSRGRTGRRPNSRSWRTYALGVAVGATVPLLVSPDGKEAVFDRTDPQINAVEVVRNQKKADKERFRRQLEN
jgi:hypothetical protein